MPAGEFIGRNFVGLYSFIWCHLNIDHTWKYTWNINDNTIIYISLYFKTTYGMKKCGLVLEVVLKDRLCGLIIKGACMHGLKIMGLQNRGIVLLINASVQPKAI